VLPFIQSVLKHPSAAGLATKVKPELPGQSYFVPLPCLGLCNPELLPLVDVTFFQTEDI
jgi:hypothetical protein